MVDSIDVDVLLESISRGSIGRLYTLKVLTNMGKGWHPCSEVFSQAWKKYKSGTNYVFEMGVKYPALLEISTDKKNVRVREKAFDRLKERIDVYVSVAAKKK